MKNRSFIAELLKRKAKEYGYFNTIDVENWTQEIKRTEGNIPGIMSTKRYIRKMAQDNSNWHCLKRLSKKEKERHGFNPKFGAYKYIGK